MRFANSATTIENPVNKPKYIVGTKFERASIEKPNVMVREV